MTRDEITDLITQHLKAPLEELGKRGVLVTLIAGEAGSEFGTTEVCSGTVGGPEVMSKMFKLGAAYCSPECREHMRPQFNADGTRKARA